MDAAEARRVPFTIDAATADRLRVLARAQGVTFFTLLLSAFRVLLVRYGGQDDVLISAPVTARDEPASRRMVGCLINTVVFRTRADADPAFTQLLAREHATLLGVLEHRQAPLGRVVEALGLAKRSWEQPLSQVLFQFDAAGPARMAAGVNFRIEPVHADRHSWWDVEWAVTDHGAGRELAGHLCFPVTRFEEWVTGSTQAAGAVSCALGELAPGGQATVTVAATPQAAGSLVNMGRVAAAEDGNPANNAAQAQTTVQAQAPAEEKKGRCDCGAPGGAEAFAAAILLAVLRRPR